MSTIDMPRPVEMPPGQPACADCGEPIHWYRSSTGPPIEGWTHTAGDARTHPFGVEEMHEALAGVVRDGAVIPAHVAGIRWQCTECRCKVSGPQRMCGQCREIPAHPILCVGT